MSGDTEVHGIASERFLQSTSHLSFVLLIQEILSFSTDLKENVRNIKPIYYVSVIKRGSETSVLYKL